MKFEKYLNEQNDIRYSEVLTNFEILKDKELVKKLRELDHKELSGGFGAVLNYPKENPSRIVIAYDKDEPIGWISDTKGSQNIFVKKEYRKTGVASKLKRILYNN